MNATCSPMSTVLSPMRSIARATRIIVIAHSRRSRSSPISSAIRKISLLRLLTTSSWRTRSRAISTLRSANARFACEICALTCLPIVTTSLTIRWVGGRVVAGERNHLGDVHALIAHPLERLHQVQQGRDQAEVGRHRRLRREQGEDRLMHLEVAAVDDVVVGDDQLGELDVVVLDRLDRAVELRHDQVEAARARAPRAARAPRGIRCGRRPSSAEPPAHVVLGGLLVGAGEDLLRRPHLDQPSRLAASPRG